MQLCFFTARYALMQAFNWKCKNHMRITSTRTHSRSFKIMGWLRVGSAVTVKECLFLAHAGIRGSLSLVLAQTIATLASTDDSGDVSRLVWDHNVSSLKYLQVSYVVIQVHELRHADH
jgi:hypothetical protein